MEAAVPSRIALSARIMNHHVVAGGRSSIYRGRYPNIAIPIVVTAAGKGGGVLDRPAEKISPGRQSEFDVKKSRKMSPPYRVVLHNDNENRREYVVQVLMKVIPGMTVDNAVNIMQEAHVNGLAVVIVCSQSEAEEHCTSLRGNGLRSSIEPASGGC
ncbi:ATP-dependent Clp protease adapter protein CLPS1, chloroplastic isoform X2 [Brachypodium distachyon]|uniref:Adaptor protein ClpS core domain-containing protein n=1 Tax=Brachypodium distachyon TaxID=15368 RepID=I1I7A6_BRADI|nr:ATP-dependent Clp protease adapter protein CLPS1, chloroplastic isoform X2 [Brachypodium distachyon]KQJ98386.1 hypothetical protein BRADI_3g36600v3 [Brachypodium distachyon]|eukprot:XP_010235149.1 ATP-dependent Clp protease adapter protein CLPS1, chloroplastic isoform X2 [Brachypodium distachyon]